MFCCVFVSLYYAVKSLNEPNVISWPPISAAFSKSIISLNRSKKSLSYDAFGNAALISICQVGLVWFDGFRRTLLASRSGLARLGDHLRTIKPP